jgi:nickel/cobalt transporter (NiCoT) family protein
VRRLPPEARLVTGLELPASGMALFFLLGLRHGIEPDHIAAIDGLTLRAHDHHEAHAPWTGSLFALGHGLAIAVIAIAVSLAAGSFALPSTLVEIVEWLPIVLLALLGAWNLRALLARGAYRPSSVRMKLIPAALRERTDAWSTVAIGLLFALVIDTVAHVSAWSVFATHRGGWWAGAAAGGLFSVGMLIASTADSQLVSRVLRSAGSEAAASKLRRAIGWFVVILSFGVVAHAVGERLGG